MTAETLNFGPEWLRALSRGRSVTSPPPSPAMPKSKLADYRYGREEMLALYIKDDKPPEDIMQDKEFAAILQDEPVQPLALEPLTEEEQRNFSMSVNSVAVLRLMGKGGGAAPAGVAKGRGGGIRGGRGRGEGAFYQRAPGGPDDGEVGFGRGREMLRSQSWDDRADRPRFEKLIRRAEVVRPGFEEAGPLGRKDSWRADSDNWRTLREEEEEAAGGVGEQPAWRVAGARSDDGGPRSAGWRDHGGRRKFEFDFRDGEGPRREDDRDGLPEWCTDEEDGEMGTFDSSGAFMCIKKGSKDTITEEDLEFEALEEDEENGQEDKDNYKDNYTDRDKCEAAREEVDKYRTPSPPAVSAPPSSDPLPAPCAPEAPQAPISHPSKTNHVPTEGSSPPGSGAQLSPDPCSSTTTTSSLMPPPSFGSLLPSTGGEVEEDEGMKHLQQEAEKMVASLQDTSLEEESFTQALQESHNISSHSHTHPAPRSHTRTAGHTHSHLVHRDCALPLSHEAAMKWFYKDPQAEIQGPFSTVEMCEWFQAGYFSMTLLVKRGCDEGFQPLGDVIKMWGRVPFSPGPSPPPLLVRQPPPPRGSSSNMDQELLKKQLEQAATAALYQQLQIRFQHMNRSGDSSMIPSMNRSMSVPDNGSMWDMRTSASQQSGGEANLWDLTMSHSTQGPSLEQLQKLQERREVELRAKREEEERKRREEKRRQQEEQKRREEEELYRRKQQCRQQQELIMKLLQQAQPGGPGCVSGSGSGWSGPQASVLSKQGKSLSMLELETERLLKQQAQHQKAQQQRDRHGGLSMGQWGEGSVGMWSGGGMEPKGSSGGMGVWEEAVKNQNSLRNMGMKNSRSSPSLSEQYMLRKKRTEEEDKLLKLLQGMKPQDGFTTWCEQMLHALNTSANNSPSSSLDVTTIVAYLKEVESPYEVHDFIRSYLGDTVEAKEFAKQFLERRAKQKANHQRQQQQLSKEVAGLSVNNFPVQSMFQAAQMGTGGMYDSQAAKMKKKQTMMLHSDPSILGYSFLGAGDRMSLGEMETVEDY
ncbi:GRB10-interacting GYF protein 1-like isoform X2 [Coregonus clupeaformis]|uniref:GRB10-interacting GYF protein 1-like isoform X2 n=1 Tax=Coregonus clupeaformis TaxID=59861 RepID=UPI001E1C813A|nr:GRB10-interacting GYF protein 1-like isoform X2 [Coregonus clupeaformis]XP_041707034.2 GRB10-interacting GYF protein 1-like isoform X2 [Coregonus clupeaformis]